MKDKIDRYHKFLDNITYMSPVFFEAVTKGFDKIFNFLAESTEEKVGELKQKFPQKSKEGTPTEEFVGELEEKGEISPEPKEEIPPEPKEQIMPL